MAGRSAVVELPPSPSSSSSTVGMSENGQSAGLPTPSTDSFRSSSPAGQVLASMPPRDGHLSAHALSMPTGSLHVPAVVVHAPQFHWTTVQPGADEEARTVIDRLAQDNWAEHNRLQ